MPPTAVRLATFIHISDLHFGYLKNEELWYPPEVVQTWSMVRRLEHHLGISKRFGASQFVEGLLGHEYAALSQLKEFIDDLTEREQAQLIVTGDLTATGAEEQVQTASHYLGASLPLADGLGLNRPDWEQSAIPGNHDRWGGHFFRRCRTAPSITNWVARFPCPARCVSAPHGNLHVRFLRLYTDAQVAPRGQDHFLARGEFDKQLRRLEELVAALPPDAKEIRVLLLHHSVAHRGLRLEINRASRDLLHRVLIACKIRVVLTGHIHSLLLERSHFSFGNVQNWEVLEARCGTTTQATVFPPTFAVALPAQPLPNLPANTLLVHRLCDRDGAIVWAAEAYRLDISGGFIKHYEKGRPVAAELVVGSRR